MHLELWDTLKIVSYIERVYYQCNCKIFLKKIQICFFLCLSILPACLSLQTVPSEVRRGHWIPEIRVMDGCKPLCQCWDLNLGPLQVQPALLTTEPYLQLFIRKIFDQKNLLAFFLCNPLFPPFSSLWSLMLYI